MRFSKVNLIWRTVTPYTHGSILNQISAEYLDLVHGPMEEQEREQCLVLKEQVGKLKERHPCVNVTIIPEPCQDKVVLIVAELSLQHEHQASQSYCCQSLVELRPLTAKPT